MSTRRRRKCRNCGQLFRPDPRNVRHQRYCSASACRRASKAASQRRWLSKAATNATSRIPAPAHPDMTACGALAGAGFSWKHRNAMSTLQR